MESRPAGKPLSDGLPPFQRQLRQPRRRYRPPTGRRHRRPHRRRHRRKRTAQTVAGTRRGLFRPPSGKRNPLAHRPSGSPSRTGLRPHPPASGQRQHAASHGLPAQRRPPVCQPLPHFQPPQPRHRRRPRLHHRPRLRPRHLRRSAARRQHRRPPTTTSSTPSPSGRPKAAPTTTGSG